MGSFYQHQQPQHYQYQYGSGYNNYFSPTPYYGNYYNQHQHQHQSQNQNHGYNYPYYNYPQKPEFEEVRSYSVSTALAIPSIINQILSYSPITDLKRMRNISRQWNEESCKIIRRKLLVRFNDYGRIKSFMGRMTFNKSFCQAFSLGPEISLEAPIVQQFILDFGPCVRSIEIYSRFPKPKPNALQNVIFECLPNLEHLTLTTEILEENEENNVNVVLVPFLPNLKSLKIQRCSNPRNTNPNGAFESLIKQIITAAPNLEEIGAFGNTCDNALIKSYASNTTNPEIINEMLDQCPVLDTYLWSLLQEINASVDSGANMPLKKINLTTKVTADNVQLLTKVGFSLTNLDLIVQPDVTNSLLQDLFNAFRGTLKQLKLRFDGDGARPEQELDLPLSGRFPLIQSVELEKYQGSLRFIENVPNILELVLRRVNLHKVVLKDAECPPKSEGIAKSLRSLRIFEDHSKNHGTHKQRSIQTVQKLGQQFPSLRDLRLEKLVDESLCLIYAQWPNLEKLEIVEGLFTDAGTTSIHPNAYKVILREEAYELFNLEKLRQGLFVGSLPKLTSLKIHSPNITDVTMILGVLQCPKIRQVSVQSNQITDTSLYRLAKRPRITHLTTENCNQLTTDAIRFATKKLKERGGQVSLNEYKGPFDVFKVRDFLRRNPTPRVFLKRLRSTTTDRKPPPTIAITDTDSSNTDESSTIQTIQTIQTDSEFSDSDIVIKDDEMKPEIETKDFKDNTEDFCMDDEKPMPKSVKMRTRITRSNRTEEILVPKPEPNPKPKKIPIPIVTKCTIKRATINVPYGTSTRASAISKLILKPNHNHKMEKMERQPRRCPSIFRRF